MDEALGILKIAQIPVKSTSPLPASMIPHVLRLPPWAFTRIAAQMLTIRDAEGRGVSGLAPQDLS
jgi:2-dehydropantoate 2-reductase